MNARPVLVSLALDHESNDVVRAAAGLARRTGAPLAAVHALGARPLESAEHLEARIGAARESLLAHLAPAAENEGVELLEPVVAREHPAELAIRTALTTNAQTLVTGGGGPATVKRWILGSTAERIVRGSPVPVYLARGSRPEQGTPVLCPIDLSAQSRTGLHAALRMATLFGSPLRTLTVLEPEERGFMTPERLDSELVREETVAREEVARFLAAQDLGGVEVEARVVVGDPTERILEASEDAWLLVLGSRGFTDLLPTAIGRVTERVLRFSRCNALAVRDDDPAREEREAGIRALGELAQTARTHLAAGEADQALAVCRVLAARLPANASIQETLADALDALGRTDEAERHRSLASIIRGSFG